MAVVQDYDTIQTAVLKYGETNSVQFDLTVDDWDYVAIIYAHNGGDLTITWPDGVSSQDTMFHIESGSLNHLVGLGFVWRTGMGKSITVELPLYGDIACVACIQIYHASAFGVSSTDTSIWMSNPVSVAGITPGSSYSHIITAVAYYATTSTSFTGHACATQPSSLTERCDIYGLITGGIPGNRAVSMAISSAQSSSSSGTGNYSVTISGGTYVEGEQEYEYSLAICNVKSIDSQYTNKIYSISGG